MFSPETITTHLPEKALLYLSHSIRPGTILARRVEVTFHGQIRSKPGGRWQPFRAKEIIDVNRSFLVTSNSFYGPIPMKQVDRYAQEHATARNLIFGRLAIKKLQGIDLDRAAHSRFMVKSAWLPTAYLPHNGAAWLERDGNLRLTARVAGDRVELTVQVGPDGSLQALTCMRWSNLTADGNYAWIPFSSVSEEEKTFAGYTIPTRIRSTWWSGTEKAFDFLLAQVDEAHFIINP